MAKKKLGYVELFWTCPNCETLNPGEEKVCLNCGAPQPDDVQFIQKPGQELSNDEKLAKKAEAGPDIHCPYCGARNPSSAKTCSQCGGDLTGGQKRKKGRVVGAYRKEKLEKIMCPNCGAENPGNALTCAQCGASLRKEQPGYEEEKSSAPAAGGTAKKPVSKAVPAVLILILLVCCVIGGIFMFMSMKTNAVSGVVTGLSWKRAVAIEAYAPAKHEDWRDEIPSEAEIEACSQKERSVVSEPVPNSTEVCGTPYTVDSGNGVGEVVQDCEYHVYDDYCSYSIMEWQTVDTVSVSGNDLNAYWPDPSLNEDQRLGERYETYAVLFDTPKGDYTYETDDYNQFSTFEIGSKWHLQINSFGKLVSVKP